MTTIRARRVEALPGMQPVEVAHGAGTVALMLVGDIGPHKPAATALTWKRARELGELLIEQAGYAEQALGGTDEEPAAEDIPAPTCPRCGSPRWVSVSLDEGYTRRAQCVPCGAYHPGVIGPGWKSPRFNDPEAVKLAYRESDR